jgi:hypothetical protein
VGLDRLVLDFEVLGQALLAALLAVELVVRRAAEALALDFGGYQDS